MKLYAQGDYARTGPSVEVTDPTPATSVHRNDNAIDMTPELVLRAMVDGDRNYILSSWLRSYADAAEFRGMKRSAYFRMYEPYVRAMIARSTIIVVTLPEAPDVVLGWMAVEGPLLHYVLTKPRWRKLGIARFLLADVKGLNVRYTHQPPPRAKLPTTWSYDPDARFIQEAA